MNCLLKKFVIVVFFLMFFGFAGCKMDESDVMPPGSVSSLKTSVNGTKIEVTWNNPEDADFAGVKVVCTAYDLKGDSVGEEKVLDKEQNRYEVQDDGEGKDYIFSLTSFDSNGNLGPVVTSDKVHLHAFTSAWTRDNLNHWHAAICGHEEKDSLEAHTWDEGAITKEPSDDVDGIKTYTCTICNYKKNESIHIYADNNVCTFCGYEKDFVLMEASVQKAISFSMGCSKAHISENNVHTVRLTRGYWICDHEVTQEEYEAVIKTNPSYYASEPVAGDEQGKRPVEFVNWFDAIVYCNERSVKEGLEPCYSIKDSQENYTTDTSKWGTVPIMPSDTEYARWNQVKCNFDATGYRLPTEAEWEYAARGGSSVTSSKIYSGTTSESSLGAYAWYGDNSSNQTHQVKTKKPNAYGLYDMSGNVWEWCWDWYEDTYSTSEQTNPVGVDSGTYRVSRGGKMSDNTRSCTVSIRGNEEPCYRFTYGGFRVVRTVK